jgi:hypothetical protein
MAMSLAAGERVTLSKVDAFADGVAVKQARAAGRAGHAGHGQWRLVLAHVVLYAESACGETGCGEHG